MRSVNLNAQKIREAIKAGEGAGAGAGAIRIKAEAGAGAPLFNRPSLASSQVPTTMK